MIIVAVLRLLSMMTTMICIHTVSGISSSDVTTLIFDLPTMSVGIVFNERLEKSPHPCWKRCNAGSEIGFEKRPRGGVVEKLGELRLT
jgi:hypothetical protein